MSYAFSSAGLRKQRINTELHLGGHGDVELRQPYAFDTDLQTMTFGLIVHDAHSESVDQPITNAQAPVQDRS